ncbi:nucleotide-binding protein [bacterium]|nr:nucleotide-binding protein [bacterium]RIK55674.1 MAG: nucleotide-binding protein [candidate division KSB1 bacterium]
MLLASNSRLREDFFERDMEYFAPNYIMVELFEHKEDLLRHSKLSLPEVYELLHRILEKINFVSENSVSRKNKLKAYKLCKGVDEDDTPIVALALELNAHLWTNDKRLKRELRKRGFKKFFIPKNNDIRRP